MRPPDVSQARRPASQYLRRACLAPPRLSASALCGLTTPLAQRCHGRRGKVHSRVHHTAPALPASRHPSYPPASTRPARARARAIAMACGASNVVCPRRGGAPDGSPLPSSLHVRIIRRANTPSFTRPRVPHHPCYCLLALTLARVQDASARRAADGRHRTPLCAGLRAAGNTCGPRAHPCTTE